MLTQSRLREVLFYNVQERQFTWIAKIAKHRPGDRAGTYQPHYGQRRIKLDRHHYSEQSLALFYLSGIHPDEPFVPEVYEKAHADYVAPADDLGSIIAPKPKRKNHMPRKKISEFEKAGVARDAAQGKLCDALYNYAIAAFHDAYPEGDDNEYEYDPPHEFASEFEGMCSDMIGQLVNDLIRGVATMLELRKAVTPKVEEAA
jgi:hypothetical protein